MTKHCERCHKALYNVRRDKRFCSALCRAMFSYEKNHTEPKQARVHGGLVFPVIVTGPYWPARGGIFESWEEFSAMLTLDALESDDRVKDSAGHLWKPEVENKNLVMIGV